MEELLELREVEGRYLFSFIWRSGLFEYNSLCESTTVLRRRHLFAQET